MGSVGWKVANKVTKQTSTSITANISIRSSSRFQHFPLFSACSAAEHLQACWQQLFRPVRNPLIEISPPWTVCGCVHLLRLGREVSSNRAVFLIAPSWPSTRKVSLSAAAERRGDYIPLRFSISPLKHLDCRRFKVLIKFNLKTWAQSSVTRFLNRVRTREESFHTCQIQQFLND